MKPSLNLRVHPEARIWLAEVMAVENYLNVILALTHPSLHDNAEQALQRLCSVTSHPEITSSWTSVFTGIAVIANRTTPSHTDHGGRAPWYDTLLNLGNFSKSTLDLPGLGGQFSYPPGTIVNICGNILEHRVNSWGKGDRVCYAHFMREKVLRRLKVDYAGWAHQDYYNGLREYLSSVKQ